MMPGIQTAPAGTLVDRALRTLGAGPADSGTLAREAVGLARASAVIADRVMVALLGGDPRVRRLGDGRWALVAAPGAAAPLAHCTFAVVDVETTGARAVHGDRVTEIAVASVSGGRVELVLDVLVDPERPIPHYVTAITRITDEMVRGRPTFGAIADDVVAALAGRVFVAHNARFDWRFVAAEVRRARDLVLEGPQLCTLRLARRLVPALRSRALDSLAHYFGIEITNRHRAAGDAVATARLLVRLLELAAERGIESLEGLEELGRRRRRRRTALPTAMDEL